MGRLRTLVTAVTAAQQGFNPRGATETIDPDAPPPSAEPEEDPPLPAQQPEPVQPSRQNYGYNSIQPSVPPQYPPFLVTYSQYNYFSAAQPYQTHYSAPPHQVVSPQQIYDNGQPQYQPPQQQHPPNPNNQHGYPASNHPQSPSSAHTRYQYSPSQMNGDFPVPPPAPTPFHNSSPQYQDHGQQHPYLPHLPRSSTVPISVGAYMPERDHDCDAHLSAYAGGCNVCYLRRRQGATWAP